MIELDSALIILMAEVLAVVLVLAIGLVFFYAKRKRREHRAADLLISRLEEAEIGRIKKLEQFIKENCVIENDKLRAVLKEISQCERALYQQILQIFLKRDVAMLKEIDRYINKLSMQYCQILKESSGLPIQSNEDELNVARAQISRLKKEGALLSEQLQMAMQTMDEISNEYTRVFNGTQSELELMNSSKKMLSIFQNAESTIRASFKTLDQAD